MTEGPIRYLDDPEADRCPSREPTPTPGPAARPDSLRGGNAGGLRRQVRRIATNQGLIYPAEVCLAFGAIVLAGALIGWLLVPPGAWGKPSNIWSSFFRWDSYWYLRVAQHGYQWIPGHPGAQFDVAFFPAYPLLEAAAGHVVRAWPKWLLMAPSVIFGFGAMFGFHRLAQSWLGTSAARTATLGYALWPGASFVVSGYPVSLLNLCVILSLLALRQRRTWLAASWAAAGATAGPLGVLAGLAVPLQTAADRWPHFRAPRAAALGTRLSATAVGFASAGITCLGIAAFAAYQWVTLGSPLAFVSAQAGWGSPSALTRLERALTLYPLTTTLIGYAGRAHSATYAATQDEMAVQAAFGALALALVVWLVFAQRRVSGWPITLASLSTIAAYYWFNGTVQGSSTAFRELYVAVPMFIGLGVVATTRPSLAKVLLGAFALLLGADVAATVAGYLVV